MPSSVASASSNGGLDNLVVERGPVEKNGVVYYKIKRCPCCQLLNSDPNPVQSGPLGVTTIPTLPWKAGTSVNPSGPICKICYLVLLVGGFWAQFNQQLEAFLNKRKQEGELMGEWKAAYKHFVESADIPERLGKRVQALLLGES